MKRFATILLALVMILSLAVPAFAAEGDPVKNNSITINNAKVGETYKLYKLFDLVVNDEITPTAYTYTINPAWAAFFAPAEGETPAGPGAQYITVNEAGAVVAISDEAALAKAAAEWANKPDAAASVTVAEGQTTAVFADLENGYWLVTSTLGTVAMTETTPDAAAVIINEKNNEDTIEKEVKEDSTGKFGDENDAQVGDIVEFKSVVKIVKGTRNVVVHDKMDAGLTYTAGSVTIEGLTKGAEYTVNEAPTDGDTFDITFDQAWIDGLDFGKAGYLEYTITYTATLNENAVVKDENGVAIKDQYNKTYVSYGEASKSTEDSTVTTTHKTIVNKYADGIENLAGAVFSLKKDGNVVPLIQIDENNYRVAKADETGVDTFTTNDKGDIVIWGLDSDEYTLEEISAPAGYNKLADKAKVVIDGTVDVLNQSGSELPDTGGVGTTMFYLFGGVMVLAAVVLLVTKKRMTNVE